MSAVWRVLGIESILLGIVLGIESIPKSWYRPGTTAETERFLHSQSQICLDDESLDLLGWCALVPPLPKVPRIRVGGECASVC